PSFLELVMSEVLKTFLLRFFLEALQAEMMKLGQPDVTSHLSDLQIEHKAELSSLISDLTKTKD
ncbi:hypothetical protein QIL39_gp1, partial [ssRNA phage Zoerhiza.2_28]